MRKFSFTVMSSIVLASCQGAYNTSTSAVAPVIDDYAKQEKKVEGSPVFSGGILMHRTDQTAWEAPKREVDKVKSELSTLKRQLSSYYSAQEKEIAAKFSSVESRVAEMREQEMKEAAQDAELLALVKEKFDAIDNNISYFKAYEASDRQQQETLLNVLDEKFMRVEERMAEVDLTSQTKIANQRQEVRRILQELENERLRQSSYLAEEIASLQNEKENLLNALDQKFMEFEENNLYLTDALVELKGQQSENFLKQLEIQSKQEQARRQEMLAMMQSVNQKKAEADIEIQKQKAVLEEKIVQVKEKLAMLEREEQEKEVAAALRRARLADDVDKKLLTLEETYGRKISALEYAKEQTEDKLVSLNEKEVLKLQEENQKVRDQLAQIKGQEKVYQDDLDKAIGETKEMQSALNEVVKLKNILQSKLILNEGLTLKERTEGKRKLIALSAEIKEKKSILSEREEKQKALSAKLLEIKEKLRPNVEALIAKREGLTKRLKESKVEQVISLREERTRLTGEIESLMTDHRSAIEDAKVYRTALEQRRYDYEKARRFVKPVSLSKNQTKNGADIASTIQGVSGDIDSLNINKDSITPQVSEQVLLRDYEVVIHEDQKRLKDIVQEVVRRAEPFTGAWQVKWKLRPENQDVVAEKFSLDVESSFSAFADYLSNYMKGYRGFSLTFNMFNEERVLVITDERY